MTSLIDVIFLLLLFFMLTSTFSKFSEVRLSLGGSGATAAAQEEMELVLLRMTAEGVSLNASPINLEAINSALAAFGTEKPLHVLLSVAEGTASQDFVTALHRLSGLDGTKLTVIR